MNQKKPSAIKQQLYFNQEFEQSKYGAHFQLLITHCITVLRWEVPQSIIGDKKPSYVVIKIKELSQEQRNKLDDIVRNINKN